MNFSIDYNVRIKKDDIFSSDLVCDCIICYEDSFLGFKHTRKLKKSYYLLYGFDLDSKEEFLRAIEMVDKEMIVNLIKKKLRKEFDLYDEYGTAVVHIENLNKDNKFKLTL